MASVFVVNTDVALRVWCSDNEQASVQTFWYHVAAVGALPATDQDFADQFEPFIAVRFKGILHSLANYRGVQVQVFASLPNGRALNSVVFNNADAGGGTAGSGALPRQTCGLASFQTAFPGPSGRGRTYYPFPAIADDIGDGSPTAGYISRIGSLTADFAVGIAVVGGARTATLVRIIRHRGTDRTPWVPGSPVAAQSVSNKWATQRRRGSFGRANVSPV